MKHGKCEELVSQHCGVDVREWAEVSAGRVDDWPVFGRKKVVFERQRWRCGGGSSSGSSKSPGGVIRGLDPKFTH